MSTPSFRLGVHGLPPAEAGLVRALVRLLAASNRGLRWSFVADGACDALVADAQAAQDAGAVSASRGARAVLFLATGDSPPETDVLRRPLRPEPFGSWLLRMQGLLAAGAAPAMAAPQPRATRYRLRRWPPAPLLQGDPGRVRMASALSRRFLTTRELAMLIQQDEEHIVRFVHLLQGFGVIDTADATVPQASRAPVAAPAPRGLIQGIRRRLGLWLT
jgi:hypothetical protein